MSKLMKIRDEDTLFKTTSRTDLAKSLTSENVTSEETVISVRNVSKMYSLYADPRDRLKQSLWHALPEFLRGESRQFYQEFWALHDLSLDIGQGETVGIIGRNGSGKSTLLQILAGTLTPTQGEVQIKGRVAALLELGSGFNPQFTGRENVYLNGSIWGMKKEEIDLIFDEIVAFADIGPFIDQPVKHYSSGMFVRLAFAVQAFVPKEMFIVDEALSVGDEAFQRKCMASLERFRANGGTVLLVSHDLQTIVRQCDRCLLLSQGELLVDGPSKPVADLYQKLMYSDPHQVAEIIDTLRNHGLQDALSHSGGRDADGPLDSRQKEITSPGPQNAHNTVVDWFDPHMPQTAEVSYSNGKARLFDFKIYNEHKEQVNVLVMGRQYFLTYRVEFYEAAYDVHFGTMLKTKDGLDVAGISSKRQACQFECIPTSTTINVSFAVTLNIAPGTYFLNAGVDGNDAEGERTYLHRRVDICMIRVLAPNAEDVYGLAYLDPDFSYSIESGGQPAVDEVRAN